MTVGMSTYLANEWLDAIGNAGAFQIAGTFLKLHIGDPGGAGTANPATETTRQAVSWGSPAAGVISNDVAITWTNIAGSQDATHWSLWDNATAGNFLGSGTITANAFTAGDTYTIPIGDLDISLTVVAAGVYGLAAGTANSLLGTMDNVSYSVATPFIQLHTGDPGTAGTANVATETTRKSISFGVAAGGLISNDVEIVWTTIAGSQDATHFTIWTASTVGTFVASGTITANPYTAGDTYTIPVGDLDLSLPVAA